MDRKRDWPLTRRGRSAGAPDDARNEANTRRDHSHLATMPPSLDETENEREGRDDVNKVDDEPPSNDFTFGDMSDDTDNRTRYTRDEPVSKDFSFGEETVDTDNRTRYTRDGLEGGKRTISFGKVRSYQPSYQPDELTLYSDGTSTKLGGSRAHSFGDTTFGDTTLGVDSQTTGFEYNLSPFDRTLDYIGGMFGL